MSFITDSIKSVMGTFKKVSDYKTPKIKKVDLSPEQQEKLAEEFAPPPADTGELGPDEMRVDFEFQKESARQDYNEARNKDAKLRTYERPLFPNR
jgi:hypothetical protein